MNVNAAWEFFVETGDIIYYLIYKALETENNNESVQKAG